MWHVNAGVIYYNMANEFPNPDQKWKPGVSANPGGLTKEQIELRRKNRDTAMAIEEKLLAAQMKALEEKPEEAIGHIRADALRLIHVAIERHDGKPTQQVDTTSSDGSASLPTRIVLCGPEDT